MLNSYAQCVADFLPVSQSLYFKLFSHAAWLLLMCPAASCRSAKPPVNACALTQVPSQPWLPLLLVCTSYS